MKKRTDEKIGKIKIIEDFLPRPKGLVLKEKTAQVIRVNRIGRIKGKMNRMILSCGSSRRFADPVNPV